MTVTIFRQWARPDMDATAEAALAAHLYEIVRHSPGFVSAKEYRAADGEVVFLAVFETAADVARWRDHPEHVAAKRRWAEFYAGYRIQTCAVTDEYGPGPPESTTPAYEPAGPRHQSG